MLFRYIDLDKPENNAYIVSSKYETVPIISSETEKVVGQAYPGFAISMTDSNSKKANLYLNGQNTSSSLYIPMEYMEATYISSQSKSGLFSWDMIYIKSGVDIYAYNNGKQQLIANLTGQIGPIFPISYVSDGYLFTLGLNYAYVTQEDVLLIKTSGGA